MVVPQEGFLFNGTDPRQRAASARAGATDAEVDAALRAVGAYERFAALPEGLDTEVRERGSRLSAGEKQLVSLARAALADPAVLVLDEATSSLDPGTEALVEAAVDRLIEGRTVVVIAHRLSTAERADRVGVVDGGELVELGPHAELVARGGPYARLYATWVAGTSSSRAARLIASVVGRLAAAAAGRVPALAPGSSERRRPHRAWRRVALQREVATDAGDATQVDRTGRRRADEAGGCCPRWRSSPRGRSCCCS